MSDTSDFSKNVGYWKAVYRLFEGILKAIQRLSEGILKADSVNIFFNSLQAEGKLKAA